MQHKLIANAQSVHASISYIFEKKFALYLFMRTKEKRKKSRTQKHVFGE